MASTVNFYSASYDKIQSYIDSSIIVANSYVLCKDDVHKNELIFIDKELKMQPIVGYEQNNIVFVNELPTEKYRTDAFYVCNNIGYLYINGIPVPVFKELSDESVKDYDLLDNIPIVNKHGDISSPIVLSDLDNGSYSISGQYKIGGNINTVFVPSKAVMVLIDSDEECKYITKLGAKNIYIYEVNLNSMDVVTNKYATQSWILEQGYVTETYVNQAIENLYNKIATDMLITKVSQLENDAGYLTADNFKEISYAAIDGLF